MLKVLGRRQAAASREVRQARPRVWRGPTEPEGLAGQAVDRNKCTLSGYQWGLTWDTWDLVGEFATVLTGEGLIDAVREAMHDRTWVEVNFAHPRRDEALSANWERFCEAVQYETRYVFWLRHAERDGQQLPEQGRDRITRRPILGGLVNEYGIAA